MKTLSQEVSLEPIICIQCGNEFELSVIECNTLLSRGFDLPKRCPDCRKHKSKHLVGGKPRRRRDKKKHYLQKYELD